MAKEVRDAEAEIRALIDTRVEAIRRLDVEASTAGVDAEVRMFDVVNPLVFDGGEAMRERARQWFSTMEGPIGYEVHDLKIVAGDQAAFSYGLNHVSAPLTNGGRLDMWWRSTVGYRREDGVWKVAHEHNSVPFDPATGKASLDLKP